jgi:hypothetical protein
LSNILFLCFVILFSNSSQSLLKTKAYTESQAKTLIEKFKPVVYFHSDEAYFPTKIEDFKIDWTKANLSNSETFIDTKGYKGATTLSQNLPLYVSFLQNSDGTIRISYMFLYAWNDKGPELNLYGKAVGLGVDKDFTVGSYGLGVHYSDVEHIEVYLKSDGSFNYAYYAYHSWGTDKGDEKYSKDLAWEDGHPVVYCSKGSHASYTKSGEQVYKEIFYQKGTGYKAYAKLKDNCSKGKRWLSTNVRFLKFNGNQVSGISNDELYLGFKYSGRLGVVYKNDQWDSFLKNTGYSTVKKVVKTFSKSAANKMDSGINSLKDTLEAECAASNSFYGRGYW